MGSGSDGVLRFGLLGCGTIAPTHADALRQIEGVRLEAVADVVAERAEALAHKFSAPRVHRGIDELIADRDLDVIAICTPSGCHGEPAVRALRAGKHVIVEKPMEVTLEACDRMIEAERSSGRVLSVICQHRFDGASMLAKQIVSAGELGRLILADAEVKWWRTQAYYDSGDWRGTWALDGGGALMNQGIHTVDLLQWLAGGVRSVYARTATAAHERIEVEDIAVLSLRFANGALGSLTATTAAYDGYPVRLCLCGVEGTIQLEGDHVRNVLLRGGKTYDHRHAAAHAIVVAKGGTASVNDPPRVSGERVPGDAWGDAHRAQILDVVRAIRGGGRPLIDGAEGRRAVAIIRAAYESARADRPVDVP